MNATELIRLLNSTHRFLSRLPPGCSSSCHDLLKTLKEMRAGGLTWDSIVSRYLDGSRSDSIKVPFQYVLSLVARRCVVLDRGVAEVPIADILKVMAFFFENIVLDGMADARLSVRSVISEDERMVDLLHEIRGLYYAGRRITTPDVTMECGHVSDLDIDKISICFPPCMQHLHRVLRKKHRLRHFSRIQYTLFLKEIGLPITQALRFWQREYSQTPRCHENTPGCTHNWQRDGRRYTYSIRHLYGLEGSRVNYRAHSCRSLQDCSMGHGEEGGCPFQHFDDLHLSNSMSQAGITLPTDKKQIIDLARKGNPQHACHAFFKKSVAFNLEHLLQSSASFQMADSSSNDKDDRPSKKLRLLENSCHLHENATHAKSGHDLSQVKDSLCEKRNLVKPIKTTQTNTNNQISHILPNHIVSSSVTAYQTRVCPDSSHKNPLGSHLEDSISSKQQINQDTDRTSNRVPVLLNQEEQILIENPMRRQDCSSCTIHGCPVSSSMAASTSNVDQEKHSVGSSGKHSVVLEERSGEETTSKSLISCCQQLPRCHTGSTSPQSYFMGREHLEEPNDINRHKNRQSNTRSPSSVHAGRASSESLSRASSKCCSRGPSESRSRGPSESHSRNPSAETLSRGLSENHSRDPSERHTGGPSKSYSKGPSESHFQSQLESRCRGPSESHSEGHSSESHFQGPSESHSRDPSESHPGGPSETRSRTFSNMESQNQTVNILRSIHIEKPTDYYRSYIRLLESLHQLEDSKS
ncbi:uncharacterized protein [Asterias amurensis]